MEVRSYDRIAEIPKASWEAIAGDSDPFVEHSFLHLLEFSGAVCETTGWAPKHLTVWDGDLLVAALPLYLKAHSYGEFIFDWAWAQASHRIGAPYYPKAVSMVPFTPTTGTRLLLTRDNEKRPQALSTLLRGLFALLERTQLSSLHLLFVNEREHTGILEAQQALAPESPLVLRHSFQFHWHNQGYASMDDYLSTFRASARKQARRERRRASDGLRIETRTGSDITQDDWRALARFYSRTCDAHGSPQYLPRRFFEQASEHIAHRAVAVLAYDGNKAVAGTLNFEKGKRLYGRYWGALGEYDCLHFELCYYRLIERAIEHRLEHFEAGAQGLHKLKRGLLPSRTYSLHAVKHPLLRSAVEDFLPREAAAIAEEMATLEAHAPFHRG